MSWTSRASVSSRRSRVNGYDNRGSFIGQDEGWPRALSGRLWKKSPNPLRLRQYQQRFVEVKRGHLEWSSSETEGVRGSVDFGMNACEVIELSATGTTFEVRPLGGHWTEGDFTGIESGRTLVFDCADSEHAREKWMDYLRGHMEYAVTHGTQPRGRGSERRESSGNDSNDSEIWDPEKEVLKSLTFLLGSLNYEDGNGIYPLKNEWVLRVDKPPVPVRDDWQGVYTNAPRAFVEDLAAAAKYMPPGVPLDAVPGQHDLGNTDAMAHAPCSKEDGALRAVLQYINYCFILQGRPPCWYAGVDKETSSEVRNDQDTKSGLYPGHFDCMNCFSCPHGGTGGVSDLLRNCITTQASLCRGGMLWMNLRAGYGPFTAPFGLQAVPLPSRAERAQLLKDPEFAQMSAFGDCNSTSSLYIEGDAHSLNLKRIASKLYTNGHGPYVVVYKRPPGHEKACIADKNWSTQEVTENARKQVASNNESRVWVYPPPGMILRGSFQSENIDGKVIGRKGLPGEDKLGQHKDVNRGTNSTIGGPTVKVHFISTSDHARYTGCSKVEMIAVETGDTIPVWVSDVVTSSPFYQQEMHPFMLESGAALWVIPKPVLAMSTVYQVSATLKMDDEEPIQLVWSFVTFGPRVYDVPSPDPEDATKSLDWALETISDMKMKPRLGEDKRPVASVICLKAGVYHVKARFLDPGPWLHIEGAGQEETTVVIDTPEQRIAFDFPDELDLGERGKQSGYEFGWQNPDVPVFNMVRNCFLPSEHTGGGLDPEGFVNPQRLISMRNITLKHNVPLVLGSYGCLDLTDCHIVGPMDDDGKPQLNHRSGGAKIRLSEVTRQPIDLFRKADRDGDGLVDRQELQNILSTHLGYTPEEADEWFEEYDKDEDGYLDNQEFDQLYRQMVQTGPDVDIFVEEQEFDEEEDLRSKPLVGRKTYVLKNLNGSGGL